MGLDGTQCAWANQPHLAVCPLSPTPRAPDVLPGIFPGRASLFLDLVPPIPLWGQREHVSPRPPPDPPRVAQVLEEQLRVHGHPDLLSSGHCPCPKSLPHALAWAQRYRRAVSQTLSALSWHQGGRGG